VARNVAVLVGSLRAGALSRLAAHALIGLAPDSLRLRIVEIGALPLYNQDIEPDPPESWTRFRDEIRAADAVLVVTPEYNRSVTGALKNAIDVGSRPWGQSVWSGKPAGVVSLSPGSLGGYGANLHVRQILTSLNMMVMPNPEAFWRDAGTFFDAEGRLHNEATRATMQRFVDAYAAWVERMLRP
jgi:chromate reductase